MTYFSDRVAVRGFAESLRQKMISGAHPVKVTCVHPRDIKPHIARNGL